MVLFWWYFDDIAYTMKAITLFPFYRCVCESIKLRDITAHAQHEHGETITHIDYTSSKFLYVLTISSFVTVVAWFRKFQCVAEYTNIIPTNYTWTLPQTCVVLSILKYRTNQVSDMVYCSSRFNRTILKLVITLSATTNLLVNVLVNNARASTFVWRKMKYLII